MDMVKNCHHTCSSTDHSLSYEHYESGHRERSHGYTDITTDMQIIPTGIHIAIGGIEDIPTGKNIVPTGIQTVPAAIHISRILNSFPCVFRSYLQMKNGMQINK